MARARHAHEQRDVAPRVPVWIAAAMLALIAASLALVVLLMQTVWAPAADPADPFAGGARATPQPVLQTDPRVDMRRLREKWHRQLHTYGWVDKSAGIARIPIDAAMDHIAEHGLAETAQRRPPPLLREFVQPDREAL